jgi:unsaturated rhamnogalacturonyl hydrolase
VMMLKCSLAANVQVPGEQVVARVGRTVLLDYYFNNEWRPGRKDSLERFHYTWEDTTNSGFSFMGSEITKLGGNIESVECAPTKELLERGDVYVIVDPDTEAETKNPNYVTPSDADVVEAWVRNGGILLLMANDKGNCDLEHFNILARRFGMSFNEDCHHKVVGKQFDMGAFTDLPDHPIFANVKKIYMKEVASIQLSGEAAPVLQENGKTFLACAKAGEGMVVAVGDPWLYNEYVDGRKLPADFENEKAGTNLFAWLLSLSRAKH